MTCFRVHAAEIFVAVTTFKKFLSVILVAGDRTALNGRPEVIMRILLADSWWGSLSPCTGCVASSIEQSFRCAFSCDHLTERIYVWIVPKYHHTLGGSFGAWLTRSELRQTPLPQEPPI